MLEKIIAILEEQLGAQGEITEETSFKDDLGADSLDLFELITRCEEEYDIEFPDEVLANLKTVGDVINFMKDQGIDE